MKLTAAELASVRAQGLYITEKCDGYGKLLIQTFRHTIAGKPEVYCSAVCRDRVYFGDRYETKTQAPSAGKPVATLQKCQQCDQEFTDGRRKALSARGLRPRGPRFPLRVANVRECGNALALAPSASNSSNALNSHLRSRVFFFLCAVLAGTQGRAASARVATPT